MEGLKYAEAIKKVQMKEKKEAEETVADLRMRNERQGIKEKKITLRSWRINRHLLRSW